MTSTAADAVRVLNNGQPPDYTFLLRNIFRVLVPRTITTARETNYFAVDLQGMLRFQSGPDGGSTHARVRSFLIPVTAGGSVFSNSHFLPSGSFATIRLATGGLRAICTEQLRGCTVALGWDAANRRLHVGHVEPDDTIPEMSDRTRLCHYMRNTFKGFEGVTLRTSNILFVGGDRTCWSDYYGDIVNILGFLYNNTIRLVVQVVTPNGRDILNTWTLDFPSRVNPKNTLSNACAADGVRHARAR